MSTILVTSATGTNGKELVKELIKLKANFIAASRNPEEAKIKLGPDTTIVKFSFDDPSTFEEATKGVDKVFLLGPPLVLGLDQLLTPFIDFLKSKNIKRVVYFSALKAEKMGESLDFHTKIEEKLIAEDFDYTILKPSFFSQNFKNYEQENIEQRGITFMPAGTGKVGFVDVHDIAAVTAAVLTQEGHSKKIYELTGPETLSYLDAANILSEVIGTTITYPNPSPDQFKEVVVSSGAPEFIAEYLINVYNLIASNNVDLLTNTIESITGKKPNTLKIVLERDFKR